MIQDIQSHSLENFIFLIASL